MTLLFTPHHFTTVILVAMVIALVRWERQLYTTYLSPFFLIAVPYTIIVTAINFIAIFFGYFTVSYKANLLVILYLGLFFLVGLMVRKMFPQNPSPGQGEIHGLNVLAGEYENYYRITAAIAIIAGLLQFRQVIGQIGLVNVGTPQFKELYGGGILGHITLLSRPAFFFLFAMTMKRWSVINFFLLFIIFSIVTVPQVKYQIIVLALTAAIYGISTGVITVTMRKVLFAVVAIYFLFNISYVIGFSASGLDYAYSEKVQAFLFNHFFTYLFGGPIGFSEILEMKQYPHLTMIEVLAVATNTYKAIVGDSQYVEIIIRHWLPISSITQYFHSTNTFGLFGMLYAFSGIFGTGLFTMLYAGLAYTFFQFSLLKNQNLAVKMAYAYIGAYLILSFFGLYLNMLPFYEVLVYILGVQLIIKLVQRLNQTNYMLNKGSV